MSFIGATTSLSDEALDVAEDGIGTYSVTVTKKNTTGVLWAPLIGKTKAEFPELSQGLSGCGDFELVSSKLKPFSNAHIWELIFKGIFTPDIVLVSVDGGSRSESLQNHPDFSSWTGSIGSVAQVNGSWPSVISGEYCFRELVTAPKDNPPEYKFTRFKDNVWNQISKTDTYISPAYSLTITDVRPKNGFDLPNYSLIGLPSLPGWTFDASKFLLESVSVQKLGSAYRRTRRYSQNGRNPWNTYVYASPGAIDYASNPYLGME
jgi:hypothetical protein